MKPKLFKTAVASIGCSAFPAGAVVSVAWEWNDGHQDWYIVSLGGQSACYPASHLSSFVL